MAAKRRAARRKPPPRRKPPARAAKRGRPPKPPTKTPPDTKHLPPRRAAKNGRQPARPGGIIDDTIIAQRRAQVMELRRVGYSYRAIAAELGMAVSQVGRDLAAAVAELGAETGEAAAKLRAETLALLDNLLLSWTPRAATDAAAAQIVLRILDARLAAAGLKGGNGQVGGVQATPAIAAAPPEIVLRLVGAGAEPAEIVDAESITGGDGGGGKPH